MSNLLTVQNVAEKMQVDPRTVRAWIKSGKMAGIQLPGGEFRIKEEHLNTWMDKKTLKAKAF